MKKKRRSPKKWTDSEKWDLLMRYTELRKTMEPIDICTRLGIRYHNIYAWKKSLMNSASKGNNL